MIIALQENIVRISFKRNAWEVASTSPSFKVFMASYLELLGADPELMYVVIFCRCRNIQKHRTISIFENLLLLLQVPAEPSLASYQKKTTTTTKTKNKKKKKKEK